MIRGRPEDWLFDLELERDLQRRRMQDVNDIQVPVFNIGNIPPRKRVSAYAAMQSNPATRRGSVFSKRFYGDTWQDANDFQRAMRRSHRFYGQGAYFSRSPFWADAFRAGGRWLGNQFLPGAGGDVGHELGARASKFLGFGAYDTPSSSNDLVVSMPGGGAQQTIGTVGDESGDLIVRNTEFIGNISVTCPANTTSSPFTVQTWQLNPGIQATFPFLSQIAQNYDLYEWHQLLFQFKPLSGESGAASNNLGSVIMATNYDPDAPTFINKIQMENYAYSNSTKPSCGAVHGVECKPGSSATNMLYTRVGLSTRDRIFTDIGTFNIATEGVPFAVSASSQTQIIGELHVTYTVKLSRPQLFNTLLGLGQMQDIFAANWLNGTSTLSSIVRDPTSLIGGAILTGPGALMQYYFPSNIVAGTYQFTFVCDAEGLGGGTNILSVGLSPVRCQVISSAVGPDAGIQPANNDKLIVVMFVRVTAANAICDIQTSAAAADNYSCRLIVHQVNSNGNYVL